jgi:hypothetical protein
VHLNQSGLGLPDESYYREDAYAEIRTEYLAHLRRLAALVGLPESHADTAVELETALAAVSWDRVTNRDAEKTYTLLTDEALRTAAPGFDWSPWLAGLQAPDGAVDELVVRQPDFVTAAAELWAQRPLEQWKAWLALRVAATCSDYLHDAVVQEDFAFHGRTLSGTPELRERWKRGVAFVEGAVGEAVGRVYVERHFPPAAKERMAELVANLVEAYRRSISELDWMGPRTRERALEKLARFTPKIGYPDVWKDYSDLEVRADDLLGNAGRAAAWYTATQLAKIGKPVDRDEWLMTPQTVNAYYHPRMNEIVFPAGDPAAAVLRPRGRRRRQLRRHRRGDRPRDRPRLRRPGQPLRRRRHHDRLVDPRGPRGVRPALDGPDRAVRRALPRRPARAPGQRRADRRREHRRPRRADDRAEGVPHRHRGHRAAGAGRLHRRPARPGRLGPGVAGRHPRGRGRAPARDRPALPARTCAATPSSPTSTRSTRRSACRRATGCSPSRGGACGSGEPA